MVQRYEYLEKREAEDPEPETELHHRTRIALGDLRNHAWDVFEQYHYLRARDCDRMVSELADGVVPVNTRDLKHIAKESFYSMGSEDTIRQQIAERAFDVLSAEVTILVRDSADWTTDDEEEEGDE